MKQLIFYLGVAVMCLIHGTFTQIPLDMVMEERMSKVKNITQWCELMNLDDCEKVIEDAAPIDGVDETGEKMVVSGGETSEIALFDACNPRNMTIALPRHPDPDITVWPTCTRAIRCGGCCTSDVFSCEPTEIKEKFVKVFDTRLPYIGAHRFQFLGVRAVKIIEHVQCDAQCKTKKHQCHKYQKYEARKCRCVCRDERLKLRSTCSDVQIWDDAECDCICPNRNTVKCPDPSFFSTTTCKCTLKTAVGGEIDLDLLFAQLDAGLIGSDIILNNENDINAENEIDMLAGGETIDEEGETADGESESEYGEVETDYGEVETDNGEGQSDHEESEAGHKEGESSHEEGASVHEEGASDHEKGKTDHGEGESVHEEVESDHEEVVSEHEEGESVEEKVDIPTTTEATTITEDPCPPEKLLRPCFGFWKPKLLSNGKCQCFPPFG